MIDDIEYARGWLFTVFTGPLVVAMSAGWQILWLLGLAGIALWDRKTAPNA